MNITHSNYEGRAIPGNPVQWSPGGIGGRQGRTLQLRAALVT